MIRNVMRSPDVIGVEEVENLATLQALADKVNADALDAGGTDPDYQAFLEEGNDIGGIDVGFLVKHARVDVIDVTQEGKDTAFDFDGSLLNDRPSLVLRASVRKPSGQPYPVTVIVNHLRSLSGVSDPLDGDRVRRKRRAQAEWLAGLIQARQAADPAERIISVGDYNAFPFNDGYVDSIGTIRGTPTPADQVVLASDDLVDPDLVDLVDTVPADQRYSYSFDGDAQEIDHVLVTRNLMPRVRGLQYGRNNADYPEAYRNDPTRPERISDHDPIVAYLSFPPDAPPVAMATGPAEVAADASCQAVVALDGTSSSDPDGDTLSYSWTGPLGTATGARATLPLPLGTNVVSLTVDDGYGMTASTTITVTVRDTMPPILTLLGPSRRHGGGCLRGEPRRRHPRHLERESRSPRHLRHHVLRGRPRRKRGRPHARGECRRPHAAHHRLRVRFPRRALAAQPQARPRRGEGVRHRPRGHAELPHHRSHQRRDGDGGRLRPRAARRGAPGGARGRGRWTRVHDRRGLLRRLRQRGPRRRHRARAARPGTLTGPEGGIDGDAAAN